MKQISNFLKGRDLKSELMKDESFVNESKKLFENNGLAFSEKQLEEILENVNSDLKTIGKMPEEQLLKVVGGVANEAGTQPGSKPSKEEIAIEAAMSIAGALVGVGVGTLLGFSIKKTDTAGQTTKTTKKFKPAYPVLLGLGGSVVGFQLGKLIASKYVAKKS